MESKSESESGKPKPKTGGRERSLQNLKRGNRVNTGRKPWTEAEFLASRAASSANKAAKKAVAKITKQIIQIPEALPPIALGNVPENLVGWQEIIKTQKDNLRHLCFLANRNEEETALCLRKFDECLLRAGIEKLAFGTIQNLFNTNREDDGKGDISQILDIIKERSGAVEQHKSASIAQHKKSPLELAKDRIDKHVKEKAEMEATESAQIIEPSPAQQQPLPVIQADQPETIKREPSPLPLPPKEEPQPEPVSEVDKPLTSDEEEKAKIWHEEYTKKYFGR